MKRFYILYVFIIVSVFAQAQYTGGIDDGTSHSAVTNQNPLPNIYTGGSHDGVSHSSVNNQNPLPNIYTGGSDDGFSNASVTNQNPQPFAITCPADISVDCIENAPCPGSITEFLALPGASATGFCSSNLNYSCTTVFESGNSCNGVMIRTHTVSDDCGNTATCSQTITVEDNTPPTVQTQNITIYLNAAGKASITTADVNNNSFDNCSSIIMVLNITSFNCSNIGDNTITLKVKDACNNTSSALATVTVVDNVLPVAVCQNITVNLDPTGSVTITAAQIDNGSTDACGVATRTLSQYTFNASGIYPVTLTVTDVNGNSNTCIATVTVNKRQTIIVYTGDNDEQYSDHTSLSAELRDQLTNAVLGSKTINFVIGSQNTSAVTNGSGVASTTMHIYQNVGDYDVTASFNGDATYATSSANEDYGILKENASVDYTGTEFVSVPCTTCPTTTILLSALLKDTSSGVPPGDAYPGDIRKARVKFVDLNSMTNLSGWLSPGLVNPADTTRGLATYLWTVALPATGFDTYSIGVVVDCDNNNIGNYLGYAQTVINVSRSSLTEFITGGGHVIPTVSGGSYASDAGKKVNFGLNVKWNKSLKNLQGKVNIIFRRGTQVYQVKSTSTTSLSINSTDPCSKKAIFISKANLQNVTNPNVAPVIVLGNLTLQLDLTDNGEPGTNDRIGISLFNGNTLVYASNTAYNLTLPLNGGNIVVHNGVNCPNNNRVNNSITTNNKELVTTPEATLFTVKAWPNPTENNFILQVMSNNNEKVEMTVFDISGKLLKQMKGNAGQIFRFGDEWKAGTYVAMIIQGRNKKIINLIKQ